MSAIAEQVRAILSQPIKNPTIETLASWVIAELPDGETSGLTIDQQRYLARMRQFNQYAAACWISLSNGSNPIKEWEKGDKIDKLLHDSIWATVYEHQALLNLLTHTYEVVSEGLKLLRSHPGYQSAFELFIAIVTQDENQHFESHLQQYWRFSLGEAQKNHDLLRRTPETLTKAEITKLKRLAKSYPANDLKSFALEVCRIKAKHNELTRNLFKAYQDKVIFNHDVQRRACVMASKGRLSGVYSYEVRKGVEYRIKRGGGTS